MIVIAEIECMLYNSHSLKDKRSVLKKIMNKLRKDFNVALTELDYHDLWQRTKIGIVTISTSYTHAEQIIQEVFRVMDTYSEMERTITHVERI
ncbi:DUF503 domain-containing protein [Virgibacillus necropolis]|uniref:DUF503 domain-containing protein n=1 Tax=Virgibacillus necropolis TaxID=163877 RepID=A0A221MDF0_9BACI|nr:DUF503 domain-containing protein [Virgibacillus necropolis]ASN05693.1 hypothetical protein CFK40_12070 [Virgibacillus necropolis]